MNPFGEPASINGVVRYGGEHAQRGYRLTRMLVFISRRENREAFLAAEEACMQDWQLSDAECALVRARDYRAMLACGVNVYAIVKAGYVFGNTLMEIGRSMRGESMKATG